MSSTERISPPEVSRPPRIFLSSDVVTADEQHAVSNLFSGLAVDLKSSVKRMQFKSAAVFRSFSSSNEVARWMFKPMKKPSTRHLTSATSLEML